MGSLLLAAGEKGKRHALPNSSIMIHRAFHLFSFRLTYLTTLQNHRVAHLARHPTSPSTHTKFCACAKCSRGSTNNTAGSLRRASRTVSNGSVSFASHPLVPRFVL